jgi:hypothetical protein
MKYFAYGSNMLTERFRARVGGAVALSEVFVCGYRLRFHKRSDDGSGKCNIIETGSQEDRVYGVVFEIPKEQLPRLDEAEGFKKGYDHKYVPLLGRPEARALTYVAETNYIDERLLPYKWYHRLVIAGAEQRELPPNYIAELRKQDWKEDPKPNRCTKVEAEKLLATHKKARKAHETI